MTVRPSLQLPKKEEEKLKEVVKKPEETVEATVIVETLRKLREQIDIFPEFYERLDRIEAKVDKAIEQRTLIISLLNSKLELDKKEEELMDMLRNKMLKEK